MKNLWVAIFLFLSAFAHAEDYVEVYWGYRQGTKTVWTPDSVMDKVRACGHNPGGGTQADRFPVSKLRCPGLLDFSRSKAMKKQLLTAMTGFPAEFRSRVEKFDIAFSKHAAFVSRLESIGERKMAVNFPNLNLVIVNEIMWNLLGTKKAQNYMLLHEILGKDDLQYEYTSRLMVDADQGRPIEKLPDSGAGKAREEAGAYVVGHGGETTGQYFKASLIATTRNIPKDMKTDVPKRFQPSIEEMVETIQRTPVTLAPMSYFKENGYTLCTSLDDERKGEEYCGGFVLKGLTGTPFLIIPDGWGVFKPQTRNRELVKKVLKQVYYELAASKGYPL